MIAVKIVRMYKLHVHFMYIMCVYESVHTFTWVNWELGIFSKFGRHSIATLIQPTKEKTILQSCVKAVFLKLLAADL